MRTRFDLNQLDTKIRIESEINRKNRNRKMSAKQNKKNMNLQLGNAIEKTLNGYLSVQQNTKKLTN